MIAIWCFILLKKIRVIRCTSLKKLFGFEKIESEGQRVAERSSQKKKKRVAERCL